MTEQILILGGGYAGVYAALGAARARGDASARIVLVSAEPDLVNRPRLYEPDPGAHLRYRRCSNGSERHFVWDASSASTSAHVG
jgi:NADH dehydrogenase FAD-containing subunit